MPPVVAKQILLAPHTRSHHAVGRYPAHPPSTVHSQTHSSQKSSSISKNTSTLDLQMRSINYSQSYKAWDWVTCDSVNDMIFVSADYSTDVQHG